MATSTTPLKLQLDLQTVLNNEQLNKSMSELNAAMAKQADNKTLVENMRKAGDIGSAAFNKLSIEILKTDNDLKALQQNVNKSFQAIATNADKVTDATKQSSAATKSFGESASFAFNQSLQMTQSIANSLSKVMDVGAAFNKELKNVGAFTGMTGAALDALGDKARDLGVKFSTIGDSKAQLQVFSAVLSRLGPTYAQNAEAMGTFATNANILAKAGGMDVGTSVDVMTNAMLQFGLRTGDANKDAETSTRIINGLAASARAGAAQIPQVGEAILQAGVMAKGSKMSFEETTAAIQVLSLGGKTGSEAGSALRNVLGLMQKTSAEGADTLKKMGTSAQALGDTLTTKGFGAAIGLLKDGLKNINSESEKNTAMMKLFGMENASAAGIFMDNIDRLAEFNSAIYEGQQGIGVAFEMSAQKSGSASGIISKMKAQIQDVWISISNAMGTGVQAVLLASTQVAPMAMSLTSLGNVPWAKWGASAIVFGQAIANKIIPNLFLEQVFTTTKIVQGEVVEAQEKRQVFNKTALSVANIKLMVTNYAHAVSTAVVTAAQWLWNAAMLANPIGLVIGAVALLGVGLYALSQLLSKSTKEKYADAKAQEAQTEKMLKSNVARASSIKAQEDLIQTYKTAKVGSDEYLKAQAKLADKIPGFVNDSKFQSANLKLLEAQTNKNSVSLKELGTKYDETVLKFRNQQIETMKLQIQLDVEKLNTDLAQATTITGTWISNIANALFFIPRLFWSTLSGVITVVSNLGNSLVNAITKFATPIFNSIYNTFKTPIDYVINFISKAMGYIGSLFEKPINMIKGFGANILDGISSMFSGAGNGVFKGVADTFKDGFSLLNRVTEGLNLGSIGKSMITKINEPFVNAVGKAETTAGLEQILTNFKDTIRKNTDLSPEERDKAIANFQKVIDNRKTQISDAANETSKLYDINKENLKDEKTAIEATARQQGKNVDEVRKLVDEHNKVLKAQEQEKLNAYDMTKFYEEQKKGFEDAVNKDKLIIKAYETKIALGQKITGEQIKQYNYAKKTIEESLGNARIYAKIEKEVNERYEIDAKEKAGAKDKQNKLDKTAFDALKDKNAQDAKSATTQRETEKANIELYYAELGVKRNSFALKQDEYNLQKQAIADYDTQITQAEELLKAAEAAANLETKAKQQAEAKAQIETATLAKIKAQAKGAELKFGVTFETSKLAQEYLNLQEILKKQQLQFNIKWGFAQDSALIEFELNSLQQKLKDSQTKKIEIEASIKKVSLTKDVDETTLKSDLQIVNNAINNTENAIYENSIKLEQQRAKDKALLITDTNKRELELAVLVAKEKYNSDLIQAKGNIDLQTIAYRNFSETKFRIEEDFRSKNLSAAEAYAQQLLQATSSLKDLNLLTTEQAKERKDKLNSLNAEEADLKKSYRNRQISRAEYNSKLLALEKERIETEKGLNLSYVDALNASLKAVSATMIQNTQKTFDETLKSGIGYYKNIDKYDQQSKDNLQKANVAKAKGDTQAFANFLGAYKNDLQSKDDAEEKSYAAMKDLATQGLALTAMAGGQAIAEGKNVAQAMSLMALTTLQNILLQAGAVILAKKMEAYSEVPGFGTAIAIAETAAVMIGISAAIALAKAEISKSQFKDGVVNLKGRGTETSDDNLSWLSKGESVLTARATRKGNNANLFKYLNRTGDDAINYYRNIDRLPNKNELSILNDSKIIDSFNKSNDTRLIVNALRDDMKTLNNNIADTKEQTRLLKTEQINSNFRIKELTKELIETTKNKKYHSESINLNRY